MSASASATPRRSRRTVLVWAILVVVLIGGGTLGALISNGAQWSERERFDPESTAPAGTRALAQILAERGINVEVVRSTDAAREALINPDATLVLPDSAYLSDDVFEELADTATDVVVAEPRSRGIRMLFDGTIDGFGPLDPVAPQCAFAATERAGSILIGATFDADTNGCYPVGESWGLVWQDKPGTAGSTVAIDATELFTNARLTENGNAALALTLLGANERLVWFVPTAADAAEGSVAPATLAELTPGWVSPVIVLLFVSAAAVIVWRGRRFGALVRERLPVTVRGSETTRGRAHLYVRSRDVDHAADALREATLTRMRSSLQLPSAIAADAVADAVAAQTGRPRDALRALLTTFHPSTDRELVEFSHSLHDAESTLDAALGRRKDR